MYVLSDVRWIHLCFLSSGVGPNEQYKRCPTQNQEENTVMEAFVIFDSRSPLHSPASQSAFPLPRSRAKRVQEGGDGLFGQVDAERLSGEGLQIMRIRIPDNAHVPQLGI